MIQSKLNLNLEIELNTSEEFNSLTDDIARQMRISIKMNTLS